MIEYRVHSLPQRRQNYAVIPISGVAICLLALFIGLIDQQRGYTTFFGLFDYELVYYPLLLSCGSCAFGYWLCLHHYAVRPLLSLALSGFLLSSALLFMPYYAIGYVQG